MNAVGPEPIWTVCRNFRTYLYNLSMDASIPLRWLLSQQHLKLRPVVTAPTAPDFTVVQPTELEDPREFLQPGAVVLTVGVSLQEASLADYAARLAESGVSAFGFGTGLYFPTIPDSLIDACRTINLTLFEVPRETAFISLLNTVQDEVSRRSRIEQERLLTVQEQLSAAAVRGGVEALLIDTASHIRAAVAVTDDDQRLLNHHNFVTDAGDTVTAVDIAPHQLRSSAEHRDGYWRLTQAMTRHSGHRHLITVVAHHPFSPHEKSVVKHAAGLLDILLQRPAYLRKSRNDLNSLAMRLQLGLETSGRHTQQVLDQAADGAGNIRPVVVAADRSADLTHAISAADRLTSDAGRQLFCIRLTAYSALFFERGDSSLDDIATSFGPCARLRVAAGEPVPWSEVTRERIERLETAALSLSPGSIIGPYEAGRNWLSRPDVLTALNQRASETVDRLDSELTATLRTWLLNNGKMSATAEALRVHRHTVTTRLNRIATICEVDLDDPVVRAELLLVSATRV